MHSGDISAMGQILFSYMFIDLHGTASVLLSSSGEDMTEYWCYS